MKLNLLVPFGSVLHVKKVALTCLLILTSVVYVNAHGDLSIRIDEKSKEIKESPNNSKLYFERGYLYQLHLEFDKAIQDYLKSKKLGFKEDILTYRLAEVYFENTEYEKAIKTASVFYKKNVEDVKINKLMAQISFKLNEFDKAITHYNFFITNATDVRPENAIEFSEIILAKNPNNYLGAIEIINACLSIIGQKTFSLQLKKLEYLEKLGNKELIIDQYNYFILNNKRKEFWYYKKAKYLNSIENYTNCKIALQQSKMSIKLLEPKFQNTKSIINLTNQITQLEKSLNYEN